MADIGERSSVVVSKKFSLSFGDFKMLSFCYLPLIGSEALGLYDFLLSFGDASSPFLFGADCMAYTGLNGGTLNIARRKLEAIGLLETYHKGSDDDENDSFFLKTLPPLSPKKFFEDKVLSSLLEAHVKSKSFANTKAMFIRGENLDSSYENISVSIGAVFSIGNTDIDLSSSGDEANLEDKKGKKTSHSFDKEEFQKGLKEKEIPLSSLKDALDQIYSCASFYNLTVNDTVDLVNNSLNSDMIFSLNHFLSLCHDRCRFIYDSFDREDEYSPLVGENHMTAYYRTLDETNPVEFYAKKLQMSRVPEEVQEDLRKFRDEYNFTNGVVNSVIDYCCEINKGAPGRLRYWETIAQGIAGKDKPKTAYEAYLKLQERTKAMVSKISRKATKAAGSKRRKEDLQEEKEKDTQKEKKSTKEVRRDFTDEENDLMEDLSKELKKDMGK